MALLKEKERICRELGNKNGLSESLGIQALIFEARGDLDGAMALQKESERLCRELGNKDGLQASLGNQAEILRARGDLDGAMALHKESERLCRELGLVEGLATSLSNQAEAFILTRDLDRMREALPMAEEAYRLASTHGLKPLARRTRIAADSLRLLGHPFDLRLWLRFAATLISFLARTLISRLVRRDHT
jgi:tetratricopeptide (TPR) repeat protein